MGFKSFDLMAMLLWKHIHYSINLQPLFPVFCIYIYIYIYIYCIFLQFLDVSYCTHINEIFSPLLV